MTAITAILKKVPAWLWVFLAVVVVLLILRGPMRRTWAQLKRLFMRDGGDYTGPAPDDARKQELYAMAQEAYAQLHAGIVNPMARERALEAILNNTNDTELREVARRYNFLSRDKTLYQAIDNAWMPFTTVDERLMSRLATIAMT